MGDISPHFSRAEFECPHCRQLVLDPRLIPALEELRARGPEPVIVHDGYRCEEHNLAVGGVPRSEHTLGMAADIVISGLTMQQMYDRAITVSAFRNGGVGVYDSNFLHVDVREHKARWSRVAGRYGAITDIVSV